MSLNLKDLNHCLSPFPWICTEAAVSIKSRLFGCLTGPVRLKTLASASNLTVIWWTVIHSFQSNDQIDPMDFEILEVLLQNFILFAARTADAED